MKLRGTSPRTSSRVVSNDWCSITVEVSFNHPGWWCLSHAHLRLQAVVFAKHTRIAPRINSVGIWNTQVNGKTAIGYKCWTTQCACETWTIEIAAHDLHLMGKRKGVYSNNLRWILYSTAFSSPCVTLIGHMRCTITARYSLHLHCNMHISHSLHPAPWINEVVELSSKAHVLCRVRQS